MAWTYLLIASCFEIGFVLGLKYTDGFTRFAPSVLTVTAGVASFPLVAVPQDGAGRHRVRNVDRDWCRGYRYPRHPALARAT
jgi:hypothetical protein